MRIFVDDSGDFSWNIKGVSLFASVIVSNRSLPRITDAFLEWKRKIMGVADDVEVKGTDLGTAQLQSFVKWVVLPHRAFWVSLTATDTRKTAENVVRGYAKQASETVGLAADLLKQQGNDSLSEGYRRMQRWMSRRSPQNVLWIATLSRGVHRALQHTIARFPDPIDDGEFEDCEIAIDESFIKKPSEIESWQEWLRNDLYRYSKRHPLTIPVEWTHRQHPFVLKYYRGDTVNMWDLFTHHTSFGSSKSKPGLQIADICAAISRRRFDKYNPLILPYELLEPRVVREGNIAILMFELGESSLRVGPPAEVLTFGLPAHIPDDESEEAR